MNNFENKDIENQVEKPQKNTEQKLSNIWELARFTMIAILVVVPIRVFIAQPFIVSGSSMDPTFHDKEYLIVDEISYRFKEPERNDIVIFRYPLNTKKFFIKRIIALPGETIEINGSIVKILNEENEEGLELNEPFVQFESNNQFHLELEEDEYFVMGDNRVASSDSRYWGPIKEKHIIGKAFLRLLPINKLEIKPGSYKELN